eukprot:gene10861-biopygen16824
MFCTSQWEAPRRPPAGSCTRPSHRPRRTSLRSTSRRSGTLRRPAVRCLCWPGHSGEPSPTTAAAQRQHARASGSSCTTAALPQPPPFGTHGLGRGGGATLYGPSPQTPWGQGTYFAPTPAELEPGRRRRGPSWSRRRVAPAKLPTTPAACRQYMFALSFFSPSLRPAIRTLGLGDGALRGSLPPIFLPCPKAPPAVEPPPPPPPPRAARRARSGRHPPHRRGPVSRGVRAPL